MKRFLYAALLIVTAISAEAQAQKRPQHEASPAEKPKREIQFTDSPQTVKRQVGATVYDLSRIFSRELVPNGTNTAWASVTGKFVRIQSFSRGWVMDGTINGKAATFVLRNPPQQAYDEFTRLRTQYNQMLADFKQMSGRDYASIAETPELVDAAAAIPESVALTNNPAPDAPRKARRQQRRAVTPPNQDPANPDEKRDRRDQNSWLTNPATRQLAQDIQKFDSKGYNLTVDFNLQVYAIKTMEKLENMPVYDHGRVVR